MAALACPENEKARSTIDDRAFGVVLGSPRLRGVNGDPGMNIAPRLTPRQQNRFEMVKRGQRGLHDLPKVSEVRKFSCHPRSFGESSANLQLPGVADDG